MPANDGETPVPRDAPPPPPPRRRRRRRLWKALAWAIVVPLLLIGLVVGLLYGALTTERGTSYAWRAAVKMLDGRLAGTLEGGTLANGVRLRHVAWHGADGTTLSVDRISGQWSLSRRPWRFVVDYLHIGDVDLRTVPSNEPASPLKMPTDLRLPLAIEIRDLQVAKLTLHQGASTSEYGRLLFHATSDGLHHQAAVERLDTPFGAVNARAELDGVRPFALSGDFGYSGKVSGEEVTVSGRVGGTLAALGIDLEATGMKLAGRAHVEATPFDPVPLQRATLAFDHVNPQAFAPGAPFADLAVRADLAPVATGASAARAPASASLPAAASAPPSAPASRDMANLSVAGSVSIVNAKPGALDAQLLPLIDARADVTLDAKTQRIANLNVRVVKNATVTGGGTISGRDGQFDLRVASLDLNAIQSSVRATQLSGPIGVRLAGDTQTVTLDLADAKAGLRAQGKVTLDPARTAFDDVRVSSGAGRIDLSGAMKRDANSTYNLKATLTNFDPLSLTSQLPVRQAAPPPAARRPAPAQRPAAAARHVEASVNGTLSASGMLGPQFTTKADFRLGPSTYDNLPLIGAGTVQLAGMRLLPSRASLSVAGNNVDLQGSFGAAGDRLRFNIDAPQLDALGFGLAGQVAANGDLTGTLAHPNVGFDYRADNVVFGANRLGHAQGRAQLRDGANGALEFATDARDVHVGGVDIATLSARLTGTRAQHTLVASA
ncbi:MAG TPA: translocation and assembly module protein TamB, partial [Paraburkholderia sp.]